jgi:signal peptidase II
MSVFIWLSIVAVSIFLDQITKYLTIFYLKPLDTYPLWQDVLHLTYVENTGAAFGMMKDARWIFMITSTVAIIGILVYLFWKRPESKLECLSLAFIVGGGIGNMIDRTVLGYVVDMIDFRLINFAVFNVADSFVCVGAGLMILHLILEMIREARANELDDEEYEEEGEDNAFSADAEEDWDLVPPEQIVPEQTSRRGLEDTDMLVGDLPDSELPEIHYDEDDNDD